MSKPEYIYETYIRTTPEKIWEAVTTAAFTRQYFHNMYVESDWQVGSPVYFKYADGNNGVEGEVLAVDKPHKLVYTWRFVFDEKFARERPSRVTFEIEPQGPVSRLRVTHDEFDEDSNVLPAISQGWAPIICSLKSLLETGEPLPVAGNEEKGAA